MTFLLHNFVHTPGKSHEVKVSVRAHIMIQFLAIEKLFDDEAERRVCFSYLGAEFKALVKLVTWAHIPTHFEKNGWV